MVDWISVERMITKNSAFKTPFDGSNHVITTILE